MTHSSKSMLRPQKWTQEMPFRSLAQMRLMYAKNPKMAKEWASKTPNIKSLPEKVKKNGSN
jgi:hypothetical protein